MLRVAALQMNSGTEPEANLAALERLAHEAAARGATYALSPEVTVAFAENREGLSRVAGPFENNPHIARCAQIARDTKLSLHVGSLAVALPDGRFANRSVLFDPNGEIVATYDKIHLFDATLPGLKQYRESDTYAGGNRAVVADSAGMRLGLSICYDARFPALYRALAEAGAQVIAVPAAFTVPTGEAHWEVLLRARAIETGCYVIAAAQAGQHQNGRATWGHSMIVDPWGKILGEVGGAGEGVLVADVDTAAVADARDRVPALANARPFSLPARAASLRAEGEPRVGAATRRTLAADLRAIGLTTSDTVIVHAALRQIGAVIGGADVVLAALRDAVGPAGTILGYCDWQGQEEIDAGASPSDVAPFDAATSRAARDNGFFPEMLRTTPSALRSGNPGASVAAIGGRARWLTADHPFNYGYGAGSPFAKLVEADGKVLMLGAPLDTMTLLHHAEHLARIPKRVIHADVPLSEDGRVVWRQIEEFDTSEPPGNLPEDYMAHVVEDFLATGRGRRGMVGAASSVLVSAAEIVPFAVAWLERRLAP